MKKEQGISLVELLIAMLIGLVLLNTLVQVFISNSTATKTISGHSALQENGRIAVNKLSNSFRSAGHYGGVNGDEITVVGGLALTGIGSCNHSWMTDTEIPIKGFEGASAIGGVAGLPANCIPAGQYTANSDLFVVRYGSAIDATPIGGMEANTAYLRSSIGSGINGGELLLGSDSSSTLLGGGNDGVGISNYEYKTELYFIRPCSALVGTNCEDGLDTLVRYTLQGGTLTAEEIAEGIEQLQIVYGTDLHDETGDTSQRDYVADEYRIASGVSDWNEVVSVRLNIIVRSNTPDASHTDTNTYSLAGAYDFTPATAAQHYHRKVYTKVIQLRNRSRG